jgi:nicotinamide-nucleotide amidase
MDDAQLNKTASELGQLLLQKQALLSLAESCTGGLVASLVTDIAGSSKWFDSGLVTYSNQAKIDLLGVPETLIIQHGAVSEEVAAAMAIGALKHGRATITASITGIAGPDGGTPQKPVGTVCFAWAGLNLKTVTSTHYFQGNRQAVRAQSAAIALQGLIALIS